MTTTIHSSETLPGEAVRQELTASSTERFVAIASPAPALVVGYRVRNTGANSCSVRLIRSLTASVHGVDTASSSEWTELVAPATVAAAGSTAGQVDTICTAVAVGVTSASGTTVVVELVVAK
jgi:hypothetical protein